MNYPLISIVVATLNSEKTLKKTLTSLRKQTYPQSKIEIVVVDAGSTDKTLEIAKKYKCKILMTKKIELTYAKQLGLLTAKGKYLMFLDSDEVLENKKSLEIKYHAFQENKKIKMVMLSGYKTPKNYSSINYYINEFGDPFSFFMYREGKGNEFLIRDIKRNYKDYVIKEDKHCLIVDFSDAKKLPLIELWAGGCMFDLQYFRSLHTTIDKNPELTPHIFYILNRMGKYLAITKDDNTIHYSSASFGKYLKKISSRIKYNVAKSSMGRGGFSGRENYTRQSLRIKKYFFISYSFSIIFPLLDSLYLCITRKKLVYIFHWILCFYTAYNITYYSALDLVGIKLKVEKYGI